MQGLIKTDITMYVMYVIFICLFLVLFQLYGKNITDRVKQISNSSTEKGNIFCINHSVSVYSF